MKLGETSKGAFYRKHYKAEILLWSLCSLCTLWSAEIPTDDQLCVLLGPFLHQCNLQLSYFPPQPQNYAKMLPIVCFPSSESSAYIFMQGYSCIP